MEVELMTWTKDAEMICASAAYTSHKKESTPQIVKNIEKQKADEFLERIIKWQHFSIFEHASFTFGVSKISRACTHQLVRHRIASFTQQSQRYVRFKKGEIEYKIPEKIKQNEKIKQEYIKLMDEIANFYQSMLDEKIPPEDARYILPNASFTNIIITMNARELRHFFNLRCHPTAQMEIRELAFRMLKICYEKTPAIFKDIYEEWRDEIEKLS